MREGLLGNNVIAVYKYLSEAVMAIWSHFTHKPGNPKLTNNKLFQYLAKFYADNLNDCAIDKYKSDTGIYEAYHIQQNLSLLVVA